jgi:hypothetical protein
LTGTTATAGTYTFTVRVTDSLSAYIDKACTLTVSVNTPSITTTCPLTAAVVNVAYSKTFEATGGSGSGYTWALSSRGTLPTAFNLSTGGVLTGTATATGGPYSFTVQVTDSGSKQGTKDCQLTVTPTPTCTNVCIGSTSGWMFGQPKYCALFARYQAGTCSSINTIYLQAKGTGNARVAIYSDNGGNIGTLLKASSLTPISTGMCNPITIDTTSVPAGYYWLAYWMDTDYIAGTYVGTGTTKYIYTSSSFTFTTDSATGALSLPGQYGVISAGTNP